MMIFAIVYLSVMAAVITAAFGIRREREERVLSDDSDMPQGEIYAMVLDKKVENTVTAVPVKNYYPGMYETHRNVRRTFRVLFDTTEGKMWLTVPRNEFVNLWKGQKGMLKYIGTRYLQFSRF